MLKRKRLPHRQRYKSRPSRNLYRFRLHGHDRVKVNNSTFPHGPLPTDHSPLPIPNGVTEIDISPTSLAAETTAFFCPSFLKQTWWLPQVRCLSKPNTGNHLVIYWLQSSLLLKVLIKNYSAWRWSHSRKVRSSWNLRAQLLTLNTLEVAYLHLPQSLETNLSWEITSND